MSGRGGTMDGDTRDLAIQFCTKTGMMMEDTSALPAAVLKIERAALQIHALVTAAGALLV